jgi:hypothetical protein
MTYIRNPRYPIIWESDGEYDKPGYKAKDGVILSKPKEADDRDKYLDDLHAERLIEQKAGKP